MNTTYANTKQDILEGTFSYLVKFGLENLSIRKLCKYVGFTEGALYYWYKNKDELICEAAEYGLKRISDSIFAYFYESIDDLDSFFDSCLLDIDNIKKELRFIYHMASSPAYGELMRKSTNRFVYAYDEYAGKLSEKTGGNIEEIRPIVHIFAAAVVDYAVWQDKNDTQIQLNYIRKQLKNVLNADKIT